MEMDQGKKKKKKKTRHRQQPSSPLPFLLSYDCLTHAWMKNSSFMVICNPIMTSLGG